MVLKGDEVKKRGLVAVAAILIGAIFTAPGAATDEDLAKSVPGTSSTFPALIDRIGAKQKTLEVKDTQTISSDLTIPANVTVKIVYPGHFSIATTKTLTINGGLEAGLRQIFSCAGSGKVVFGPGAVKEVHPEWWANNTTPGVTDMSTAAQQAVNTGQAVEFAETSYYFGNGITEVGDYQKIYGKSWLSTITTFQDITLFKTKDGARFPEFKDLTIRKGVASTKFHILGVNPVCMTVDHCQIRTDVPGWTYAGIATYDGVNFNDAMVASGFMLIVKDCVIGQGSVLCASTDSYITNNYIWASEDSCNSTYAVKIQNAGNVEVSHNNIVPSNGAGGGVYYQNINPNPIRILNNYFDGGYATTLTGWGFVASATTNFQNSVISGNQFQNLKKGGIRIPHLGAVAIINNNFYNCNLANRGEANIEVGSLLYDGAAGGNISNNTFMRDNASITNGYVLNVTGSNHLRMRFENNSVIQAGTTWPMTGSHGFINWPTKEVNVTSLRGLTFNGNSLKRKGTATIPAGQTTITKAWETLFLGVDISQLIVTPGYMGGLTVPYKLSSVTNGGFTINIKNPVAYDVVFNYNYDYE